MPSKKEQKDENAVHPMVPVPDAIRTVLTQTAKSILSTITSNNDDAAADPLTERIKVNPSTYTTLIGRILAHDVSVPSPGYPPYDASIMDGYAISSTETLQEDKQVGEGEALWTHEIVDCVYAGDTTINKTTVNNNNKRSVSASSLPYDELADKLPRAAYITTGAVVPPQYDVVIPIEECVVSEDKGRLKVKTEREKLKSGLWIRKVGCDMTADSVVLKEGEVLESVHLGLLVQVGVYEVDVRCLPKVGVLSTGNELLPDGIPPTPTGQIPDANRPILLSKLFSYHNCIPVDLGIVTDDDYSTLKSTLLSALQSCHVLITTGGISMGEKDVMERMFVGELGATVHFGRLHMKPGKPTTFLTWKSDDDGMTKFIFALPGNPVSATVCTDLVVKPCLDMLHGSFAPQNYNHEKEKETATKIMVDNAILHPEILAALPKDFKLDAERPEYHRVSLKYIPNKKQGNGKHKYEAWSTGVQRSSRLMSCCNADGLLCLPQGKPGKKMKALEGEEYPVLVTRVGGTVAGVTGGVKVVDSMHVSGKLLKVALVRVAEGEFEGGLKERVGAALGLDIVRIVGEKSCTVKEVVPTLMDICTVEEIDLVMVICCSNNSTDGDNNPACTPAFQSDLDVSLALKPLITKTSDAMALQARRGAASTHPLSALFEVLIGFMEDEKMLLCLPDRGLEGALLNIGGLLKHAVLVSRGQHGGGGGKSHHHHHHHHH